MKKLVALLCTVVMVLGLAGSVMAAGSITTITPQEPTVSGITLAEGEKVVVKDADWESYTNAEAKSMVEFVNTNTDGNFTVEDILTKGNVDLTQAFTTTKGTAINPLEYSPLAKFSDIAIEDAAGTVSYNANGTVTATMTAEVLKDADVEDLIIMQIDPETGDIYFIEIEEFNAETGEFTATFPCMGPFTFLEKTVA